MVETHPFILFNCFIRFLKSINILVNFITNNKTSIGYINDIYQDKAHNNTFSKMRN